MEQIAADKLLQPKAALEQDGEWDRQEDPSILRIRTREDVSRDKVLRLVESLVSRAGLTPSSTWSLAGDAVGRLFAVQFTCGGANSGRHVGKIISVLRGSGGWEEVLLPSIAGPDTNVFISRDENKRSAKLRFYLRPLPSLMQELQPHKKWFTKSGRLSAQWTPILEITPRQEAPPVVQWCQKGLLYHGLDRTTLEGKVRGALEALEEDWEFCL